MYIGNLVIYHVGSKQLHRDQVVLKVAALTIEDLLLCQIAIAEMVSRLFAAFSIITASHSANGLWLNGAINCTIELYAQSFLYLY